MDKEVEHDLGALGGCLFFFFLSIFLKGFKFKTSKVFDGMLCFQSKFQTKRILILLAKFYLLCLPFCKNFLLRTTYSYEAEAPVVSN